MQRRQKQPQAPGSLAPERTQRHAGMPSPHPHAAPRGCPPALAGGRTGTAKTQPCSGEEALSAPHPEPAAGGGRVASLPRAGLGQPGFPRTAEPAMPAPAAPTRPPPAARAEPPRGPRRVLAGGCRSPRTPPSPSRPSPTLTGLRRFSVTFFQSRRWSWCRNPMAAPRRPRRRALPGSAPPRSAPQLTRRPPPCPGRRLCPQQARLRGERAGRRPCPCPSPCPSPLPSSARPAQPCPAWPGPARPCAAPPPCRGCLPPPPLKGTAGPQPPPVRREGPGGAPLRPPRDPCRPGGGGAAAWRGRAAAQGGGARAPAGRAVTERARPLAEAAPMPPQRRGPPQRGGCAAAERPAGGWRAGQGERCARRPQLQGERDLSSCGAGEGVRPAVSVPASSW